MQKTKPYRSQKHLAWIRSKPCVHCRSDVGVISHHIIGISLGTHGVSTKSPDSLAIPLCVKCHAIVHAAHGTVIINQLWYFYQLIRLSVRNRELVGYTDSLGFCVASDDVDYLTDFANKIRDAFANGDMVLK